MELYIKAKCNREIDKEREYATFESFEIMLGDTPICFDFMDTEISVSKTDPSIIEYRGRDLDTESFPKSSQLEQHAKDITSLEECRDDFETAPGSKPLSVNKILVYIIAVDKTDKNKDLSGKWKTTKSRG